MKKMKLIVMAVLLLSGIIASSCQSRNPHCPGVYHMKTPMEQPQKI